MLLGLLWEAYDFDASVLIKLFATMVVVAFAANHILLLLLAQARDGLVYACLRVTLAVMVTLAALIVAALWNENSSEPLLRGMGVLAILDVLGTIAVPVLVRVSRASAPSDVHERVTS